MLSLQTAAALSKPPQVDVVMMIGDSNTVNSNNSAAEIPTGYNATDNNAFIWDAKGVSGATDVITTLIPGLMEAQPNGGNGVGPCAEFVKHYRTDNPNKPIYFFMYGQANGRFSDASARGRAANFVPTLTDGAHAELKTRWQAFVTALRAQGKTPRILACRISMGGNATFAAGEVTSFQTDMETWIAALVSDGIIKSDTKIVLEMTSLVQTGLTGSANIPAIRTAQRNLVLADPNRREILSSDGFQCPADNIHWGAATFVIIGETFYYHCANLWYPQKEQSFNGGNPVTHEYRPGDLRNTAGATAFTTTGGNLQTAFDCAGGGINPTQATDANRPTISVTNTPNGYGARYATGNSTSMILTATTTFLKSGTNCIFAALSAAANGGSARIACGEGSSSSATPLLELLRSETTTGVDMVYFQRTDASVITGATTIATGAFNGTMNALFVTDTGSSMTGYVNGTAGTPLSYTRGTITTDRFSLYGLVQNGANGFWIAAKIGIVWFTAAVPDSTYLANARAYLQRRWGTA